MKTLHLFAGAGGGLLADLILGHKPVCAVEIDPYCCKILRERAAEGWFPGLQVWEGDVQLFDPSPWAGRLDCISAGFPCQDISCAGRGAGIEGEKSGLWSEVVRCVRALRPAFVFLENSPNITSRGLFRVLGDLAALGYDAEWCVLGAAEVGAPHIRKRWWGLAYTSMPRFKNNELPGNEEEKPMLGSVGKICNTNIPRLAKWQNQPSDNGQKQPATIGTGWWSTEPGVGRVVDGMASRADRLKALGNGQVPLQAAAAWMILTNRIQERR